MWPESTLPKWLEFVILLAILSVVGFLANGMVYVIERGGTMLSGNEFMSAPSPFSPYMSFHTFVTIFMMTVFEIVALNEAKGDWHNHGMQLPNRVILSFSVLFVLAYTFGTLIFTLVFQNL